MLKNYGTVRSGSKQGFQFHSRVRCDEVDESYVRFLMACLVAVGYDEYSLTVLLLSEEESANFSD